MTELAVEIPIAPVIPLRRHWIPARCRAAGLVHYTHNRESSLCGCRLRAIEKPGTLPTCVECFRAAKTVGYVYLLHFDEPFGHARHYCGWSSDPLWRIRCHTGAAGSNLMRHVNEARIGWLVAGVWPGTRSDERSRHRSGGASRWCPECRGERTGPRYGVECEDLGDLPDGTRYIRRIITPWRIGSLVGG